MVSGVRVPQIVSLETAIQMFHEKRFIGNKEIITLFGNMGSAKVCKLKKLAKEQMDEDGEMIHNAVCVSTKSAYKAWGLDIEDLEKHYQRLIKLGLHKEGQA